MQQFTLYLFIAGQATLRHGSESIRAMTGQTWLLPPGWTYRIRNPETQCCRWLEIQLELLIDRSLSEHPLYRLRLPAGVENPANMDAVVADFTAVAQAATRTERDLLLRPQVDALIGHYLCSGFASGAVQTGDDRPPWLEEVLAAIAERPFAERTTIASIAAQVGIAVSTIQHALRQYLGSSFSQLQKERRIAEAQHLMASNRAFTVADVARRCGYPNPGLFYRHFKEVVGHSPRGSAG
jgi:AraC-like DNA-binding protein